MVRTTLLSMEAALISTSLSLTHDGTSGSPLDSFSGCEWC